MAHAAAVGGQRTASGRSNGRVADAARARRWRAKVGPTPEGRGPSGGGVTGPGVQSGRGAGGEGRGSHSRTEATPASLGPAAAAAVRAAGERRMGWVHRKHKATAPAATVQRVNAGPGATSPADTGCRQGAGRPIRHHGDAHAAERPLEVPGTTWARSSRANWFSTYGASNGGPPEPRARAQRCAGVRQRHATG